MLRRRWMRRARGFLLCGCIAGAVAAAPLGLPPLPAAGVPSAREIALGQQLFFDRRLSFNGTLSCAMCHIPEQGFAQNELATPVGFEGRVVERNAPTLLNVAYRKTLFSDGRESSLEMQVWSPLLASNEMANPSIGFVLARLDAVYRERFRQAYGEGPTVVNFGRALAAYERTLVAGDAPFDRWYFGGDQAALSRGARQGFETFTRSQCTACHRIANDHAHFTDENFHDTGVAYGTANAAPVPSRVELVPGVFANPQVALGTSPRVDLGRYRITLDPADRWRFRTPSLRNVALTAPYMHDGRFATLDAVIAHYNAGGAPHDGQDPRIRPLGLSADDARNLVAFLESLTGGNVAQLAAAARTVSIGDVGTMDANGATVPRAN
jgi:cytochrome c peroxidase